MAELLVREISRKTTHREVAGGPGFCANCGKEDPTGRESYVYRWKPGWGFGDSHVAEGQQLCGIACARAYHKTS